MCGITGILNKNNAPVVCERIVSMTNRISHRGPDDEGYVLINTATGVCCTARGENTQEETISLNARYSPNQDINVFNNDSFNLALGHRRLSIIDLSATGHQPMSSEDGNIWIVYNGEIYNYPEIKAELLSKGHRFYSLSDTEVIIKAYQEWGVECLSKFNGMWAFCLWDSRKKQLFCARDRFGIKPFYYYVDRSTFAFASEIKSLLILQAVIKPNEDMMYDFLHSGILDHTESTFYQNIQKLAAAHYMIVTPDGAIKVRRYWDFTVVNEVDGAMPDLDCNNRFLQIFTDSIRIRLRSDVPIGSCLSGGLDSSSVVTVANQLMFEGAQGAATDRQKTFSACYDNKRFDERVYIESVINKTGAESHYIFPTAEKFLCDLDSLVWHQEEPFIGTSMYAQWEVMKEVKNKGVTVVLDGQGSDEQLGGYLKFYMFYMMQLGKMKMYARLLNEALKYFSSSAIIKDYMLSFNMDRAAKYLGLNSSKIDLAANFLQEDYSEENSARRTQVHYIGNLGKRFKDDITAFSLPVLLRYEDRNSMAHAVEARLPFLDYRLVEFLASLPLNQKMRNGWTKYILRESLSNILPADIAKRKSKLGFSTPEDDWFRRSLVAEAEDKFANSLFISRYVKTDKLIQAFQQYRNGRSPFQMSLFFRFYIAEVWGRKFIIGH